jgi:hypothetical protein
MGPEPVNIDETIKLIEQAVRRIIDEEPVRALEVGPSQIAEQVMSSLNLSRDWRRMVINLAREFLEDLQTPVG